MLRDGSILSAFHNKAKVTLTYSNQVKMKAEARVGHVRWIAQSKHPFEIVNDVGYQWNVKQGAPHQYIPSSSTIQRDVKEAFLKCREKLAKVLQVWIFFKIMTILR